MACSQVSQEKTSQKCSFQKTEIGKTAKKVKY